MKNVGHVFCQIFHLWRFRLVCLWQLIILVSASQVGYHKFRVIECFCVEGNNKRSDRGLSSNNLEFFLTVLSECHFWIFEN